MNAAAEVPAQNRRVLIMMVIITIAPVLLSSLLYFYWKPQGGKSYGELLETKPVPTFALAKLDGTQTNLTDLRGKWLLVVVDKSDCMADCAATLHAIRQFRLAQGTEMERIRRLWLVSDGVAPTTTTLAAAEGADVLLARGAIPLPGVQNQGVYLIDPLGNQVMRYGRDADHGKVIKEITRLLKNNEAIG